MKVEIKCNDWNEVRLCDIEQYIHSRSQILRPCGYINEGYDRAYIFGGKSGAYEKPNNHAFVGVVHFGDGTSTTLYTDCYVMIGNVLLPLACGFTPTLTMTINIPE